MTNKRMPWFGINTLHKPLGRAIEILHSVQSEGAELTPVLEAEIETIAARIYTALTGKTPGAVPPAKRTYNLTDEDIQQLYEDHGGD